MHKKQKFFITIDNRLDRKNILEIIVKFGQTSKHTGQPGNSSLNRN